MKRSRIDSTLHLEFSYCGVQVHDNLEQRLNCNETLIELVLGVYHNSHFRLKGL